jgi:hypothetical protein
MLYRPYIACLALALTAGTIACTDQESATNLRTSGPPMIEQVRMPEYYIQSDMSRAERRVFAFGTFPTAVVPDEVHAVTQGAAKQDGAGIRIIFGSLLIGNYLEELRCNGIVDDDAYDKVPLGATPDDIAKCSSSLSQDVLDKTCVGDHAVCICHNAGGCGGVPMGSPVGVLDENGDGAADVHQLIKGAVGIKCHNASLSINVPIDQAQSYYNPSGFQEPPAIPSTAGSGYDQMGPAVVLFSAGADGMGTVPVLPTNMTCGLTFDPDVVGKNNVQVCAPPMGRPASCNDVNIDQCDESCTPGDVSAFSFGTEALVMLIQGLSDGQTGWNRTDDLIAYSQDNVPVDAGQIGTIQVFEGAAMTPYTQFTVSLIAPDQVQIHWTNPTGLAANTMYTVTFPTAFQDSFHVGLTAAQSYHFTTGA